LESGENRGNMLTRRFELVPPLYRTNGDMPYSGVDMCVFRTKASTTLND